MVKHHNQKQIEEELYMAIWLQFLIREVRTGSGGRNLEETEAEAMEDWFTTHNLLILLPLAPKGTCRRETLPSPSGVAILYQPLIKKFLYTLAYKKYIGAFSQLMSLPR